jgi:hypothetical protein
LRRAAPPLLQDPSLCFVYGEHMANVKVAKFAPTGKYIASGGEYSHAAAPRLLRLCPWGGESESDRAPS